MTWTLLELQVQIPHYRDIESICDVDISETVVLQKLSTLNVNKAPSPDGLHSYALKLCADTL